MSSIYCDECDFEIFGLVFIHCTPFSPRKKICKRCVKCEECGKFVGENPFPMSRNSNYTWYHCAEHVHAMPKEFRQLQQEYIFLKDKLTRGELISVEKINLLYQISRQIDDCWKILRNITVN